MAQPSTETQILRRAVTKLSDVYREIGPLLQGYADFGTDFYDDHLGTDEAPTTDITPTEFHAAMATLATVVGGLTQAQRQAITKLRI